MFNVVIYYVKSVFNKNVILYLILSLLYFCKKLLIKENSDINLLN